MGFFRSKKLNILCDSCKKKINDYEFVWIDEHKFCQKCAAQIQGGAPNVLVQGGSTLHGLNSDSHNYEMNIDDIFFVKNKGTVLCGTVKKGAVRQGDVVYVDKKKFTVIGIECSGTLLKEALCGMNIGLLVNCLTPHIFNVGDVVIGEPEEPKPKKDAVVPNKSGHADESPKENPFTAEKIVALKKYAVKFLPKTMDTPGAYKVVIETLSKVIPTVNISLMDLKLQNILQTNDLSTFSMSDVYAMTAAEIEKWLGVTNMEKVMESVCDLDNDGVLGVWIGLDMFGFALKEENRTEIDKFCGAILDIIAKRDIKLSEPMEEDSHDEFEILKKKCCELSKDPALLKELSDLKIKLGKMLMDKEEIWVAYDEDFKNSYPYVGVNGRMEVFTKEEYAQRAKEYFASCHEGHISIVKIAKEKIKPFFEYMLYMGILNFNLDNGISNIDMPVEDFCPFVGEIYLDRQNRAIRSYLMRYMQTLYRYNKISDESQKQQKASFYGTVLSAFLSSGITSLVNSVVYALGPGPYTEGITLYTKAAHSKLKASHNKLGIYDEKFMISPGDANFGTVDGLTSVETIKNPSLGEFVAVFTDKASVEKVRMDFKNFGAEYDYNIVAMTFDEVVQYALRCDGMIIDSPTYAHIIEKDKLNDILNQMSAE